MEREIRAKKIINLSADCSVNSHLTFDNVMDKNEKEFFISDENQMVTLKDLEGRV